MERVFTRNVGKRFKKGDKRDYPPATWKTIATNAKMKLDTFSTPVATMLETKTAALMKSGATHEEAEA